jgi:biotin operon repressor
MSRIVATLVYSKRVGTMARKAIMAYCADRANDDGTGIWASKQRIADEIECSRQTVITAIRELVADGLLSEVGRRKCKNGYTLEYNISLEAVRKLPDAKVDIDRQPVKNLTGADLDTSSHLTPRRKATLHKPSSEPSIVLSASALTTSACEKKPAFVLPDWIPADAWAGFMEMRKRKRAVPTQRAIEVIVGKLRAWADEGYLPGDILDASTVGNWTTVYKPKEQNNGQHGSMGRTRSNPNSVASIVRDLVAEAYANEAEGVSEGDGNHSGAWAEISRRAIQ